MMTLGAITKSIQGVDNGMAFNAITAKSTSGHVIIFEV